MNYILSIGKVFSLGEGKQAPRQVITINEEQMFIINMFASTRKNEFLKTIHTLNGIDFEVDPVFDSPKVSPGVFDNYNPVP